MIQNLKSYRTLDCQPAGVNVAASSGRLAGCVVTNQNASSFNYVKIYDKATAPTSGDTPIMTLAVPPKSVVSLIGPRGVAFAAGLGIRGTGAVADNDSTAPSANDLVVNLFYQLQGF